MIDLLSMRSHSLLSFLYLTLSLSRCFSVCPHEGEAAGARRLGTISLLALFKEIAPGIHHL